MPRPPLTNLWPFWFIGMLALSVFLTLLLQLIAPIGVNDLWWHIVYGRHILETGNLIVDHSQFSWTPALTDYIYNSWLSQIFLYEIDAIAGIPGLIAFRFATFLAILLLAWRYSISSGIVRNPLTWLIILLALTFMWPKSGIKPELFSLLLMNLSVWLFYHIRMKGDNARYYVYLYPPIITLWVNLHGGFFLVAPFFIAVMAGELLNARFSPVYALPIEVRKHLFISLFLCIPAILLNPYGYHLPIHIVQDIINQAVVGMRNISDYLPTYLYNAPPYYLLDYLIGAMVVFIFLIWQLLKEKQADWVAIVSFIIYCLLFIQMIRVVHYLGPVFLYASLSLLQKNDHSWAWPKAQSGQVLLLFVVSTTIVFIGWRSYTLRSCQLKAPIEYISYITDSDLSTARPEAEYISNNLQGKNMGNIYKDGGRLIYWLWPEKKVMIDSRAFPYKSWIKDYFDFAEYGSNIGGFVESHAADYWIISYDKSAPFSWFIKSDKWHAVFFGPTAAIFVPNSATNSINKGSISPAVKKLQSANSIGYPFVNALTLKDLTFARMLLEAAKNNLGQCTDGPTYIREMKNSIAGHEAFLHGDFEKASQILATPGRFFNHRTKTNEAYIFLAQQYRNEEEFEKMRDAVVKAYRIAQQKTPAIVYNLALADWLFHQSDYSKSANVPEDELTWQDAVASLIALDEEAPPQLKEIIIKSRAMRAGTLSTRSPFLLPEN